VTAASTGSNVPAHGQPRPIAERQNNADVMELLCAAAWHYQVAKRWHFVRVVGTLGFALAAPVITFWLPQAAAWVAALAALWVLAGRTFLGKAEDSEMDAGVTAQEQFDTELFGLPWHEALAGRPLAHEEVISASDHIRGAARIKKENWYANTDKAPWPLNVVLCQRSGAVWSRRTHLCYAQILTVAAWAWFLAGIFMGIAAHLTLGGYLIMLFLPSQPAFLDAMDLIRSHRSAGEQRMRVEAKADALWERGVMDPTLVTATDCRAVQDLNYRQRRHYPQVAEWYYRLRRAKDEDAMKRATESMISRL
jgi:SMODS-associating 4TM effector domain